MICFLPTSSRITTTPSCIACQPGHAKRMIRISTVRTAVLSSRFFLNSRNGMGRRALCARTRKTIRQLAGVASAAPCTPSGDGISSASEAPFFAATSRFLRRYALAVCNGLPARLTDNCRNRDGQIGQHEQREGHDGPELAPGESENLLPFADRRDESEEKHGQTQVQKTLANGKQHRQHIRCRTDWRKPVSCSS